MKVQLINNESEAISGFETILVKDNECKDIDQVIDNSCSDFLSIGTLDHLRYDNSVKLFGKILRKIRLGGTLTIRGLSLLSVGQQIVSESLEAQDFSNMINGVSSIHDPRNMVVALEEQNFITTLSVRGAQYEIKAIRQKA